MTVSAGSFVSIFFYVGSVCHRTETSQASASEDTLSPLACLPLWRLVLILASGVSKLFSVKSNPFSLCPLCHSLIWCGSLISEAPHRWWHDWPFHWLTEVVLLSRQGPEGSKCWACHCVQTGWDLHSRSCFPIWWCRLFFCFCFSSTILNGDKTLFFEC